MPLKKLPKHTVLKAGTIIDPFNKQTYKADIWIKDGAIEGIGEFDTPRSRKYQPIWKTKFGEMSIIKIILNLI